MKKRILSLAVISLFTLTFLFINACNKDNTSCDDVTCYNGGYCEDGTCVCPDGFGGEDCSEPVPPNNVGVSKIIVTRFPANNIQGQSWDATSGPDIYVEIWKDNDLIWSSPSYYENADAGQDYEFVPDATVNLADPTAEYQVQLYDHDNASEDDYLGGISFFPGNGNNGYPEILMLDESGSVAFELSLSYSW